MNVKKLIELTFKLRNRNNRAYTFFENIIIDLTKSEKHDDAIERLKTCYSITQHSDFKFEEESILKEVLESIAN